MKNIDVDSDIEEPDGYHRMYSAFFSDEEDFEVFEYIGEPARRHRVIFDFLPKKDQALIKKKIKERLFMDAASDAWAKSFSEHVWGVGEIMCKGYGNF